MRKGTTALERSGVIWHTQGSGKSLTMVFAIRKLRSCDDLKDYKVCMVNDRIDLEDQLGETAALTGEKVTFINSSDDLKKKLATPSSNLNMVMVHKFQENQQDLPDYLADALGEKEQVPEYTTMEVVNDSDRIVCMIDEAHRSQGGDIGANLIAALRQMLAQPIEHFRQVILAAVSDKQATWLQHPFGEGTQVGQMGQEISGIGEIGQNQRNAASFQLGSFL